MATDKVKLVAQFEDRMSGPMKNAGANTEKFAKITKKLKLAMAALPAVLLAVIHKLGEVGAAIYDTAKITGVNVERVQSLGYQFEQTGGSLDSFQASLRGLTTFMRMADSATSEQGQLLTKLGLKYEDLKNMEADEIFLTLTDALSKASTEFEMMTDAATIFGGRYSQQVVGLINETGGDVRAAVEDFEALGIAMSEDQVTALKQFDDAMTKAGHTIKGMTADAITPLLPALLSAFDGLENLARFALPYLVQVINDSMPALIGFIDALAFVGKAMTDIKPDLVSDEMERFDDVLKDLGETAKTDVAEGLQTAHDAFSSLIERAEAFIEAEELNEVQAAYLKRGMAALGAELYFTGMQQNKLAEETEATNLMMTRMSELITGMNLTGYTEQVNALTLAELKLAESMYQVVISSGFLSDTFSDAAVLALEEIQAKIEEMAIAAPPPGTLTPEFLEKEIRARDQIKELILAGIEEAAQAEADMAEDRLEQEQTSADSRLVALLKEKAARLRTEADIAAERDVLHERTTKVVESGLTRAGNILINKGVDWEVQMLKAIGRMLAELAAMKIGGPIGGIFGFIGGLFQRGTPSIPHAQDGWQTPTGLYGDRFPVMVEGGEEVISREQRIMKNNYNTSSSNINLTVVHSPTVSTASPGQMVVLGNVLVDALEQAGVSIG